ncbi:MAG: hypothetical protein D3X82_01265 [Candidatus Leucobacter sulfamidivorax]|nr:hypothetical protein [Candidatus Leucobacter sulfamidivorax]
MSEVVPIREVRARILQRITRAGLGEPITARVSEDEEWSPRIQGEVTIPATLDLYPPVPPNIWKLQGDYLLLELETRYGPGLSLADLTAAYAGSIAAVTAQHGGSVEAITRAHTRPWNPGEPILPLAEATALWGGATAAVTADVGGSMAAITRALRVPGGSYLPAETERTVYQLRTRRTAPNTVEGTITLELASEDVRLHDYRHTAASVLQSTHTRLRPLVAEVLGIIAAGAGDWVTVELMPGPDVAIAAGPEWKPGMTAWDFLHPVLEAVGWQLYTPADGIYRLEPRTTRTAPQPLDQAVNLIEYLPVTDLKDAYYDGAIVEYTDADELIPSQRFDVYLMPGAQRILHETRPGIRTMPGAAEQLVTRSQQRGRTGTARTTLALPLGAGQRVQILPGGVQQHGTIRSLTHTIPDAETSMQFRDITIG